MTYAGHPDDPSPRQTLAERGVFALALEYRLAHPCTPCAEAKRWQLLSDLEADFMGVQPSPSSGEPHTCMDRDLDFWCEAEARMAAAAVPVVEVERQHHGWLETRRSAERNGA